MNCLVSGGPMNKPVSTSILSSMFTSDDDNVDCDDAIVGAPIPSHFYLHNFTKL